MSTNMSKREALKTRRLCIVPLTDAELLLRRDEAQSPSEIRWYNELLAGVRMYPTHRLWCTLWELRLRDSGTVVGQLYFSGPADQAGETELMCSIRSDHQGQGYAGEALQAVLEWAWKDERTWFIVARPDHADYADTLEKLGFAYNGRCYELERPVKLRTKELVSLGVSMGLLAGFLVLGSVTAGILIGAGAGWVLGGYLDAKDRRIRENLRNLRR